ncbi:MAG: phage holin family protein [Bacteroidetes bacterium]|nr:phage holin family protein [Bacteroidota bacterium]
MNIFVRLLISTLAVLITSYLLPGVHIQGVTAALVVAAVLAILNTFLKPVVIILTIPITFFTLGLFLVVINVFIIYLVTKIVDGFSVDGFWWAVAFSIILSIVTNLLDKLNEKLS